MRTEGSFNVPILDPTLVLLDLVSILIAMSFRERGWVGCELVHLVPSGRAMIACEITGGEAEGASLLDKMGTCGICEHLFTIFKFDIEVGIVGNVCDGQRTGHISHGRLSY